MPRATIDKIRENLTRLKTQLNYETPKKTENHDGYSPEVNIMELRMM